MANIQETNIYELLQQKLKYLSYIGLNPTYQTRNTKIFSTTLIVILVVTLILTGIYCCIMNINNLEESIINLVLFGAIWQMLLKTSFCYFKATKLTTIINQTYNNFWQPDFLPKKQKQSVQLLYKATAILNLLLTWGVGISITGHCVMAILQGNYNLPVNIWFPKQIRFLINSSPYYRFIQAFQFMYTMSSTMFCVLQIDCFIAIVIAMILAQFKIMKYKLGLLGDIESKMGRRCALAEIIQHHNMLLQMLNDIEDLFSPLVLQLLGTSMFLVVISYLTALFIARLSQKLLFVLVGSTGLLQFSLYCFLGQLIQDETLSVADEAYVCNWEKAYDKDLRQTLIIIIQRSQNQVNITMGKFMILNLENLTKVCKAMFSFFTFVINMNME